MPDGEKEKGRTRRPSGGTTRRQRIVNAVTRRLGDGVKRQAGLRTDQRWKVHRPKLVCCTPGSPKRACGSRIPSSEHWVLRPVRNRLCPPAAATSSARFACACP